MRIIDFFDRACALYPNNVFLRQGLVQRTYSESFAASHRIACGFQSAFGDRRVVVGFYAPNDWQSVEAQYGAMRAGMPLAQVNSRNTVRENAAFLRDAGAEMLFFHSRYAEEASAVMGECPALREAVCLDEAILRAPSLAEWMATEGSRACEVRAKPDEHWSMVGTSGTTGRSKCVIQTHLTGMCVTVDMLFSLRVHDPVRHLVVAPISHFAGSFLYALSAVGSTHLLHDSVDVSSILSAIERERIEVLFLPPTIVHLMLAHPGVRDHDYSSLRALVYAGAPMAPVKVREAISVFGPVMCNMFGQSEANGPISCLRPEEHSTSDDPVSSFRLRSIGRASLMRQVEVMADDGRLLGPGEPGEVVLRGWGNTAGYLGNPESSAELVSHGWLHTGDIGVKDDAGYVVLVDRKKDMIVTGGFNVYSSEVEQALLAHPAVLAAAVIGVPDDKWGEAVKAVVELKRGQQATSEELMALCKAEVGSVKTPKTIEFRELPRGATGKILKREIRQQYWQGRERNI